jgi:hypothetical protein
MRIRTLTICLLALLALPVAATAMPRIDPQVARHQQNGPPFPAAQEAPVVRTITVRQPHTDTLPVVLAAAALATAVAGTAYVTIRLRPLPRS